MDKSRAELSSQLWQDLLRKVSDFAVAAGIAFHMQATHAGD